MQVNQAYELLNDVTEEVTGQSGLVNEDLSNVVDVGTQIFSTSSVDNYCKSLMNKVGKVTAVNRPYRPPYPNIKREAWEYGSVLQKLRCAIPEAEANPSWALTAGEAPDQFVFTPPTVTQQFWNSKQTYDITMSFADRQVKESFNSKSELMAFFGMVENAIQTSKTIKEKALAERAINNFMSIKLKEGNGVIQLVTRYNQDFEPDTPLTAETAIINPSFLRYASAQISMFKERLRDASNIFNMGTLPTFTPPEYLHAVFNSEFVKCVEAYMQADTFHQELVALPGFETVNYWQGTGEHTYRFDETTTINIKNSNGDTVSQSWIVGVMFDRDAIMLMNENDRVTTAYNAKGEYTNNFYKYDISLFNDVAENGIIFTLT